MIHIRNATGEHTVTPSEFVRLVETGQVREDDWILGETLTNGQWVRAGDHPFFRQYALTFDLSSNGRDDGATTAHETQREQILRLLDTLFRKPQVTIALVVVNVLIWAVTTSMGGWQTIVHRVVSEPLAFLWQSVDGEALLRFGAKENTAVRAGEYWRLLTCMFLHVGPIHLLLNGYALFMFGRFVENIYGKPRYLVIYFLAGLGGSLASYWRSPDLVPSVGASGAVFGLIGVMTTFTLRHKREIPHALRRSLLGNLVFILVLNLSLGFALHVVDNNGHIGGLLAGALLGLLMRAEIFEASRSRWRSIFVNTMVAGVVLSLVYAAYGVGQSFPRFYLQAGLRSMQSKQYDLAAQQFRNALRFMPNSPEVNLHLADALLGQGDTTAAVSAYERVLALKPQGPILLLARNKLTLLYVQSGLRLMQSKQHDLAAQQFRKALRFVPNNPEVNLYLAESLMGKGEMAAAVAAFKRVLALKSPAPMLAAASNDLAYLYTDKLGTHLDEALRLSQQSLRLIPNNPICLDTLGWIYYKQRKWKEAETVLKRAVAGAPRHAELHYHLGAVYEAQDKKEEAVAAYARALVIDPAHKQAREALKRLRAPTTRL